MPLSLTEDAYDAVQYAVLKGNEETVEYLVGELEATVQRWADA